MKPVLRAVTVLAVFAGLAVTGCVTEPPAAGTVVSLFDGRTLDGWVHRGGGAKFWAEDGMIVGEAVAGTESSFLCTVREYGDFSLQVEFMIDEGLNSGVQIRSESRLDYLGGRVHGYQVEIDPSAKPYTLEPKNLRADGSPAPETEPRSWTGAIFDEARRGWLYDLTRNEAARAAFRRGEWNTLHIEAVGDSIRTWINGVFAADLRDSMTARGFIAFQVHASDTPGLQVRFRKIRLREISAERLR